MSKVQLPLFRISLFVMLIALVGMSTGCEKYSSPRKVRKHLVKGSWKLSSAYIDNNDVTNVYANYSFTFSEGGDIDVIGESTITGNWSTGIEKNPTTLNLTLTPFVPFNDLNADWTVTTCKKDRMTLELRGASSIDVLILSKVE